MKCPIIAHCPTDKRNACQIEHKIMQTNALAFRGNIFSLRGSRRTTFVVLPKQGIYKVLVHLSRNLYAFHKKSLSIKINS